MSPIKQLKYALQILSKLNLVGSAIYRPNSKHENAESFSECVTGILSNPVFKDGKTILMGDFNINLRKHQKHRPAGHCLNVIQFLSYFPIYQDQPDSLKILRIIFLPNLTTSGQTSPRSPYLAFFNTDLPIIFPSSLTYITLTLTLTRKT